MNTEDLLKKVPFFKMGGFAIAAFICALVVMSFWPLRTIETGSRGVITVGGSIKTIEPEGFLLVMPWQNLNKFSIRAEQANVKGQGATSDLQTVDTELTVRYSVMPDKVGEVFEKYSHDGNLDSYINTATQETFKAVTTRYNAPDLIAKRAQVSTDIRSLLSSKVALYGAQIINIDMTNFTFAPSYMKAISSKVEQEQLRLAAENRLLTVQAEQKQKVAVAEAEASAVKATADGDAYATVTNAKANAQALDLQGQAIVKNPSVLELRRIEVELAKAGKWNGQLPQAIYAGAPIPFMSVK